MKPVLIYAAVALLYWSSISASRESRVNNWRQGIDALTRTPGISHGIAVSNRLGGLAQRLSASAQRRVFKTINKSRTRSLLDLTDDDELEEQEYKETRRGTRWTRVKQLYRGIPLFGKSVTLEYNEEGDPTGKALGHVIKRIRQDLMDIQPKISRKQAISKLKRLYHPKLKVKPQKYSINLTIFTVNEKARLAFAVSYLIVPDINMTVNLSYPHALIDARNGKVLKHWEGLNKALVKAIIGNEGTGQGDTTVTIDESPDFGAGWCMYKNNDVEVMNMMNTNFGDFIASDIPCYALSDPTFDYENGGFSAMNDVMYYSQKTHDIWMEFLDRPPLGHSWSPVKIKGRAHVLSCQPLAYWDGSYINFGDGVCDRMYPVTSADIVAHEIAHGFTQYTSGLVYSDESGAMNEAFSDMAGETVEYMVKQEKNSEDNDWINGAEVFRTPVSFLRNLSDPQPPSISHYDQYEPGMDVHYSSGIYNKAFYLLSTTEGWNITKAFTVMSLANAIYWEGTSTMHCGACGVELAATELGYDETVVTDVFQQVGVMCSQCG